MTIVSICTKLLDFFPPYPPIPNYLSLYSATLQRKNNFLPSHKSDIHLPFTLPISKKKKKTTLYTHTHIHTHTKS